MHAFSNTIQVDAFSVLFHYVIGAVLLVTLLGSLDYFEGYASHAGEYFALLCFGSVGMMLMTSSVELLMVFIGLEISSISTYILCGFRKGQATGTESSIKYFLLGSFATAFFLYGVALAFGATGSTDLYAIAHGLETTSTPLACLHCPRSDSHRPRLQGLCRALPCLDAGRLPGRTRSGCRPDVDRAQSRCLCRAAAHHLHRLPCYQHRWAILMWILAALSMTVGNLGALLQRDVKRMLAYSSIAHAGYLLVAFTAFPFDGIAAACFYTATYAAMHVGAFAVITQVAGYDERARTIDDYTGFGQKRPCLAALLGFLPALAHRNTLHRRILRQVLRLHSRHHAGHVWLAVIGLLNSGVACFYYLRLLAAVYTRARHRSGAARTLPRYKYCCCRGNRTGRHGYPHPRNSARGRSPIRRVCQPLHPD